MSSKHLSAFYHGACGEWGGSERGVYARASITRVFNVADICAGVAKIQIFLQLMLPVLMDGREKWTLSIGVERHLSTFGTKQLCGIMSYRCNNCQTRDHFLLVKETAKGQQTNKEVLTRLCSCIKREWLCRFRRGGVSILPSRESSSPWQEDIQRKESCGSYQWMEERNGDAG